MHTAIFEVVRALAFPARAAGSLVTSMRHTSHVTVTPHARQRHSESRLGSDRARLETRQTLSRPSHAEAPGKAIEGAASQLSQCVPEAPLASLARLVHGITC